MAAPEIAQLSEVLLATIRWMAGVTGFMFLSIVSLVIWIYNKDRKRVDDLSEKVDALPPIVEAATRLHDQVKEQWNRIKKLEETTTRVTTEHDIFTRGPLKSPHQ